jgi:NADH-quinone oxidoreductase subunit L
MLVWIPLLPFVGFLVNSLFGSRLSRQVSGGLASVMMLGSFLVSASAVRLLNIRPVADRVILQHLYTWIASADFQAPFTLRLDPLSAVMILVVTGVGFLIHVYSTSYMLEETPSEFARYFSYLNLFAAFMLVLVLGANFLVLFIGWEGVGLCSYLLIGFWYQKPAAADAGKKAFIVNRVGDVAFILGVLLAFVRFGSVDFQTIASAVSGLAPEATFGTVSTIAMLLFIGATGKSAQIPLYVWLPDAMEGPTPVSALIHAATMVTAGVYLIGRNAALFVHAPQVLSIVAVIGAATALWAGLLALVQNDIKRVLAYSTVSQLGYMFVAMGVGAYAAGIFHLFTHAFFKALLFLGSGAVIHALAGEQDLRNMGGLKSELPMTYWTFVVGTLAITGVPGLAGFFSKDEILYSEFASGHRVLWTVGTVTSLLTAIYMFRLLFLAFHGERRTPVHDGPAPHLHDASPAMAVALIVLAIGSVFAGYVDVPEVLGGVNRLDHFLEPSLGSGIELMSEATPREASELLLMIVASAVAMAGIGIAFYIYRKRPEMASRIADRFPRLYRFLVHKGYVDELYDELFVEPTKALAEGALWRGVDVTLIDGAVNGAATIVDETGGIVRKAQTGSMRAYALSVLLGVVVIVGYYLWR